MGQVVEILESSGIDDSPDQPNGVRGKIPFRGEAIPVIDLAEQYQLISSRESQAAPIIVIETTKGWLGIQVDSIEAVKQLSVDQIEPLPSLIKSNIRVHSIWGLGKLADDSVILLVRFDEILDDDEIVQLH